MKKMNLQDLKEQISSLQSLIASLASKEDLNKLEQSLIDLNERVTKTEVDIVAIKEILSNTK